MTNKKIKLVNCQANIIYFEKIRIIKSNRTLQIKSLNKLRHNSIKVLLNKPILEKITFQFNRQLYNHSAKQLHQVKKVLNQIC